MTRSQRNPQNDATGEPIELRPVDLDNYHRVLKLEVAPEQVGFLWSGGSTQVNAAALAEAAYVGFTAEAAYCGGKPVGLVVWGRYHPGYRFREPAEPGSYIIDHMMVDRAFQGRGLGRRLLEAAVGRIGALPDCRRIVLSYDLGNDHAARLYGKAGFRHFGTDHEGSPLMELVVR